MIITSYRGPAGSGKTRKLQAIAERSSVEIFNCGGFSEKTLLGMLECRPKLLLIDDATPELLAKIEAMQANSAARKEKTVTEVHIAISSFY